MKGKVHKKLPNPKAKFPKSGIEDVGKTMSSASIDMAGHKVPKAGSKLKPGKIGSSDFF